MTYGICTTPLDYSPPFMSSDPAVKDAQSLLNQAGATPVLATDGIWGQKTPAALKSFQNRHGLNATGSLDAATLDALEHAVVGMNVARLTKEPTPTPISDADLAKIAGAAYGQTPTPTGWVELSAGDIAKLGINNAMLEDPASGFSATLYRSDDGAHVIAYRGTEGLSIKDWAANIIQGGGGIATQTYAVTFDAAGLGFAQKADAWNQAGAANEYLIPEEDLIRAYYNDDDILSVFQDISIGSDASGTRISVDANGSLSDASFGAHRVELLIDELTRSLAVKGNQ